MSPPATGQQTVFRVDDLTVDVGNFRAQKNGQGISLAPRAFDVLTYLIKNVGRVVEKQEIFDSIWKDTFVSDSALTKVIKEIRHAIGDSATDPRYIETVPKRGYRFIGKLEESDQARVAESLESNAAIAAKTGAESALPEPGTEMPRRSLGFGPAQILLIAAVIPLAIFAAWWIFRPGRADVVSGTVRSIAVLPFKSLDTGNRDESLEMGMAETLITRLSNLENLAVQPIGVVRKYTDPQQDPVKAGRETGAEAVLDGTIQRSGERIRVTVRLTNVAEGKSLWTDQFDENFTEIFRVQDSIAERVATALALHLSAQDKERLAKHYTDNPEAYQLYLNAQLVWHGRRQNWIEQSLALYKQAVEKDPRFALAYVGIADCYIMLSGHKKVSADVTLENARPAIVKALEIDDTLAQAHNALAELKYQFEFDWGGAETEFRRAIELDPNGPWIRQAYGWYLMSLGRFDEAAVEMDKAHELDPSSLTISTGRGKLYYYSRQYEQAINHFKNLIAVEPNDVSLKYALTLTYEQVGRHREAVEIILKTIAAEGARPSEIDEFRTAFETTGWEGFLRKGVERMRASEKSGGANPVALANLYVQLAEKDEAIFWLRKAVESREPGIIQFMIDPAYDPLRDDPRFLVMIRSVGLQP